MDWRLEDDGGPEVVYAEGVPEWTGVQPQAIWVRVGPVFEEGKQLPEPGIWIHYQAEYYQSELGGPVLMTPEAWRALNAAVEERLKWKEGILPPELD